MPWKVIDGAASGSAPCWTRVTLPVPAGTWKLTVSPTACTPSARTRAAGRALGCGAEGVHTAGATTKTGVDPLLEGAATLVATTW